MNKVLTTLSITLINNEVNGFSTYIINQQQRQEINKSFSSSSWWGYNKNSNLYATKTKKKASSGAGGFGKSNSATKPKEDVNYSIFPALDKEVQSTLVHMDTKFHLAPKRSEINDDLTSEIYDRLDQIYGFPNFNSIDGSVVEEEKESFTSLLLQDEEPKSKESNAKVPYDKIPPFQNVNVIHFDPLILTIDNFFSSSECDHYKSLLKTTTNKPLEVKSKTTGKDSVSKKQRSSTTWFHYYKSMPEFLCKSNKLLGFSNSIRSWEEPQIVRYEKNDRYNWHLDALGPEEEKGGGQRIATLLVYLSDLEDGDGGCTMFRDLKGFDDDTWLKIQPKKGTALLFFPSAGGIPNTPFDIRTLHAGEPVLSKKEKWIAQLWLRKGNYVPTAPSSDNSHEDAEDALLEYCNSFS